MKHFKLNKEEKELLNQLEKGELKQVKNLSKAKSFYKKVAKNTLIA